MNNLFKLKKDGKTVGYLELLVRTPYGYPVLWFRDLGRLDEGREWHSGNNVQADSIHPFVTKSKDGKDVFADDEIKAVILDVSSKPLIGRIIPNENSLSCWMFKYKFEGKEYLAPAPDLKDIELIED